MEESGPLGDMLIEFCYYLLQFVDSSPPDMFSSEEVKSDGGVEGRKSTSSFEVSHWSRFFSRAAS